MMIIKKVAITHCSRSWLMLLLIILQIIILSNCISHDNTGIVQNTSTPGTPSALLTPVYTSVIPTIRPSITSLPSWTPTWTPLPTLPFDERLEILLSLINDDEDCPLPCWWGAHPGTSPIQSLRATFRIIGVREYDTLIDDGEVGLSYSVTLEAREESLPDISVKLSDSEGTVGRIFLRFYVSHSRPVAFETLNKYYLPNILAKYGIPSSVVIFVGPPVERNAPTGYGIRIVYQHLGFAAQYEGVTAPEKIVRICPEYGNFNFIHIDLQSPYDGRSLRGEDGYTRWLDIDEASGLSVDEFFQLFSDISISPCFESPENIWR